MIASRLEVDDAQIDSPLGRTSAVVKLGVAVVWLIGLALTLEPLPPVILAGIALATGVRFGGIPPNRLAAALAPLWIAALAVGVSNTLFGAANGDPLARDLAVVGPVRVTVEAAESGLALMLRVAAIASVGAVFALTTDSTRLADSLVWQARVSPRFAYGALAAFQAIPRFIDDLTTLRQARRIRGLRGGWHPRLLLGMLVLAIRHGDRLALSMDARAFGSGSRTVYREVGWGVPDIVVAVGGVLVVVAALGVGR